MGLPNDGRIKECHFMAPTAVLAEMSRMDQEIKINRAISESYLESAKELL